MIQKNFSNLKIGKKNLKDMQFTMMKEIKSLNAKFAKQNSSKNKDLIIILRVCKQKLFGLAQKLAITEYLRFLAQIL